MNDIKQKAREEFEKIIRLIELEKDDGTPIYEDGDRRVGFKEKQLFELLDILISSVRKETLEETIAVVPICMTREASFEEMRIWNDCRSRTLSALEALKNKV